MHSILSGPRDNTTVAAAGLPEARKDHAIAMAKFARDCLHKFHRLVRQMEVVLGYVCQEMLGICNSFLAAFY